MDKNLANALMDELERLFTENLALRQFVNALHKIYLARRVNEPNIPRSPTPLELIQSMQKMQGTPSLATEIFAPLRARINEDAD